MMQIKSPLIFSALGLALMSAAPLSAQKNPAAEAAAAEAAKSWLVLVDAGKYPESWTAAGTIFKNALTSEKWTSMIKTVRDPLGKAKSRKVKLTLFSHQANLDVVTVQFKTEFQKKDGAVETVSEAKQSDGKWRTVGYFIK